MAGRLATGCLAVGFALSLLVGTCGTNAAQAQSIWNGGGGANNSWGLSSNWSGGAPTSGSDVIFMDIPNLTRTTSLLDRDYTINSITFNPGSFSLPPTSKPFIITEVGSDGIDHDNVIYLGAGGIINNTPEMQTIDALVSLNAPTVFHAAVAGGLLSFPRTSSNSYNRIALNGMRLTVTGPGNVTIASPIIGTGIGSAIVKSGTGTLTLLNMASVGNPSSNYAGTTTITGGTLLVTTNSALGSQGINGLNLSDGTNGGLFGYTSGSNTISRDFTLRGTGSGFTTVNTGDTLTISGTLSGGGSLTLGGPGTIVLNNANTFNGNTNIAGGTVRLNNPLALQNSTVILASGSSLTASDLPSMTLGGLAGSGNVSFNSTALTVGGNHASTIYGGNLTGAAPFIKTGTGTLTLTGANRLGSVEFNSGTTLITGADNASAASLITGGTNLIGSSVGDVGTVTVSGVSANGTPSTWNTDWLYIGAAGSGTLNITDGGRVNTGGFTTYLSDGSGADSTLNINGGSLITDTISIGPGNAPTILLTNPTQANGGGYALNLGGYDGDTTLSVPIGDAAGGPGGINKLGAGTLTLNAANTFSGGVQINGGTVKLGHSQAVQNSTVTLNPGGTLSFDNLSAATLGGLAGNGDLLGDSLGNVILGDTNLTIGGNHASTAYSGRIIGAGSINKVGTGTLTLNAANTFSGGVQINAGALAVGNNAALGTGTVTLNTGSTLRASGDPRNLSNAFTLNNAFTINGATTLDSGTFSTGNAHIPGLKLSGPVTLAGDGALTVTGNSRVAIAGVIGESPGQPMALIKRGGGTLELDNDNTYTGGTLIAQGTLVVNNAYNRTATGSGTGEGAVTVASGATLTGTYAISGAVQVNRGGILGIGNSIGQSSVSSLTLAGGSILDFEIGEDGISSDRLDIAGLLTRSGSGIISLNLTGELFPDGTVGALSEGTFTLMTFSSQSGLRETDFFATGLPTDWTSVLALTNGSQGGSLTVTLQQNPVSAAAPEPASGPLLLLTLGGALALRRLRPFPRVRSQKA
jgi:autotransporter-associated beta strand protein/T5SS/PEP-CTERM-associated repeat protein